MMDMHITKRMNDLTAAMGIIEATAEASGFRMSHLVDGGHTAGECHWRRRAIWLISRRTGLSRQDLAEIFHRSTATVGEAIRRIDDDPVEQDHIERMITL